MKEVLIKIVEERMKAKSAIEIYRGLSEMTGKSYEREINELLDKLNRLEELEKEIRKK